MTDDVRKKISQWLPISLIILAIIIFLFFDYEYQFLSFATFSKYINFLSVWTKHHYILAVCAYMLIYILAVTISIPGAALLTMLGGFLFGLWAGSLYAIISSTVGACLLFLAVRTSLGRYLAQKAKGWLRRLEVGFQQDAWNYLLFLRLVPVFPFWVINIVPALLSIPLITFASATFLGVIPGSLIYASLGRELEKLLAAGKMPDLNIIFKPEFFLPLLALAILSLIPVLFKKLKKND